MKCIKCEGTGRVDVKTDCKACNGVGHTLDQNKMPKPCNQCHKGKVDGTDVCPRCWGSGIDPLS